MIKIADIQNLTKDELIEKEGQLKKQLMQLRFDAKLGKLEKHSTIKEMRRDIARILTVMNQQKLGTEQAVGIKTQTVSAVEPKAQSKIKTSRSAS